ncbi:MAG: helix-turn-helix transcriptional regulator [Candidatus Limnocylindrales bacterium]
MAATDRRIDRATRESDRARRHLGAEIRQARLEHDLSQATAARGAGLATSSWSRLERGRAPKVPIEDLYRAAAAVGLRLKVQAVPGGEPLRDSGQLALLERLRVRLPGDAGWGTEVPFPNPGDLRAWDAMVRLARLRIGIEAETRGRDSQALQRKLGLKRRDGNADRLILLMADTRHNRSFLRGAGEGFLRDFPVPGQIALARLETGHDPGGDAIVLL